MLDILFVYLLESPRRPKRDLWDISVDSTYFLEVQRTIDLQVCIYHLQFHVLVCHLVATSNQEGHQLREIDVAISYALQELLLSLVCPPVVLTKPALLICCVHVVLVCLMEVWQVVVMVEVEGRVFHQLEYLAVLL